MAIDRWASVSLAVLVLLGPACTSRPFNPRTLPTELATPYSLFEARCSKCHTIARPLNAPVNDMEHWNRYVARMRRMPGSGINASDATQILRFLEHYTHVIRGVERPNDQPGGPESIEGGGTDDE